MATEIRTLLDEGAAQLGRVADAPRREAEVLLGAALGRTRAWLLAHPEERILDCEATDRYEAYVTRRRLGEPVAYLLGEKEFWSLPLAVGPGVLIPRPETELAGRACAGAPSRPTAVFEALDLATGSGAIALAIAPGAAAVPRARHRSVARSRSTRPGPTPRASASTSACGARRATWYEPVAGRTFDLIVSNPPYIAADDPRVEPAVRRYEPPRGAVCRARPGSRPCSTIVGGRAAVTSRPGGWLMRRARRHAGRGRARAVRSGRIRPRCARTATSAGRERCTEGRLVGTTQGQRPAKRTGGWGCAIEPDADPR